MQRRWPFTDMGADVQRRHLIIGGAALAALPTAATTAEPGRNDAQMKDDWPWLGRYAEDNARLLEIWQKVDVVFMGDSITEGWKRLCSDFFTPSWINRGIGGQTSPQMVLRMASDVVALKPRLLHILAGTNDVAGNTGPMTEAMTLANIRAMIAIAKDARIKVVVGAIPPASKFFWNPAATPRDAIIRRNALLLRLVREKDVGWIDYHALLDDGTGGLDKRYGGDGVHPNGVGYEAMGKAALPVIRKYLGKTRG